MYQTFNQGQYSSLTRPVAVDQLILNHFNETRTPLYRDGALGGWSNTFAGHASSISSSPSDPEEGGGNNLKWQDRVSAGHQRGYSEAGTIIMSLKRSGGVITETIKIVAHSMGAAYAKGYIQAFVEWAAAHPDVCEGLSITEYDFAAFQQNHLSAVTGVPLFQYDNLGDGVVAGMGGFLNGSEHARQGKAEDHNSNVNPNGGHSIGDFIPIISALPQGRYKFHNGSFVRF